METIRSHAGHPIVYWLQDEEIGWYTAYLTQKRTRKPPIFREWTATQVVGALPPNVAITQYNIPYPSWARFFRWGVKHRMQADGVELNGLESLRPYLRWDIVVQLRIDHYATSILSAFRPAFLEFELCEFDLSRLPNEFKDNPDMQREAFAIMLRRSQLRPDDILRRPSTILHAISDMRFNGSAVPFSEADVYRLLHACDPLCWLPTADHSLPLTFEQVAPTTIAVSIPERLPSRMRYVHLKQTGIGQIEVKEAAGNTKRIPITHTATTSKFHIPATVGHPDNLAGIWIPERERGYLTSRNSSDFSAWGKKR